MSRSLCSRSVGATITALLSLTLATCTSPLLPVDPPPPPDESTTSPTPQPEPTPSTSIKFPNCDILLPSAYVSSPFEVINGPTKLKLEDLYQTHLGPVALDAISQAMQLETCTSGQPNSDAIVSMFAAELPTETMSGFITELRGSVYQESQLGNVTVFQYTPETGPPRVTWYGFHENIWVMAGGIDPPTVGAHAFEQIFESNPDLN